MIISRILRQLLTRKDNGDNKKNYLKVHNLIIKKIFLKKATILLKVLSIEKKIVKFSIYKQIKKVLSKKFKKSFQIKQKKEI
jgi:hypothetical protein